MQTFVNGFRRITLGSNSIGYAEDEQRIGY